MAIYLTNLVVDNLHKTCIQLCHERGQDEEEERTCSPNWRVAISENKTENELLCSLSSQDSSGSIQAQGTGVFEDLPCGIVRGSSLLIFAGLMTVVGDLVSKECCVKY